jgi:hypothetical protein
MNHTETLLEVVRGLDELRIGLREAPPAWPAEEADSFRLRKQAWLLAQEIVFLTQINPEDFAK